MSIISILVALVLIGLVLWVVNTVPIVWLLQAFGLLGGHTIRL